VPLTFLTCIDDKEDANDDVDDGGNDGGDDSVAVHKRSQDFRLGCTFFLKKLTTVFSRHPSKHRPYLLN